MDDVCVIGYGVVGKATALALGIKNYFDLKESNITLNQAADCRYVFICLPTPTINGECYTKDIRDIIKQIDDIRARPIYIIRSTVTPGTADAIMEDLGMDRVLSNPEFLSEDSAEIDAKRPDQIIIGGKNDQYMRELKAIYEARFKYAVPVLTDNITAEMVKYTFNTFFVLKVIFGNQIFDVCEKNKANYTTIQQILTKHPWGSGHHFQVHHKGGRGAKGRCLPKDLEAFINYSNSPLLRTVKEINDGFGDKA